MKRLFFMTILVLLIICVFVVLNAIINERRRDIYGDYPNENEFLRTIDCAPLFDSNPPGTEYKVSFDIKTNIPGEVKVYMQNDETCRYAWNSYPVLDTTQEYMHYDFDVEPILVNEGVSKAYLSFYSQYGSGIIPIVKNLVVEPK